MKINRYKLIFALLTGFFLFNGMAEVWGQVPGQIRKPATGTNSVGQLVLDPNGDGYVSKSSCGTAGFTGACADDLVNSEIPFRAIPSLYTEPTDDLRTGGGKGHTDIVAGVDDSGALMYSDGEFLYLRMRIYKNSTASKGYTFLFNTDVNNFGTIQNNNPGFQYEVVLQTGGGSAGVNIIDHRNPNSVVTHHIYSLNTHFQKAVSGANIIDGEYSEFYTFYVPWSKLAEIGFTSYMPFRVAAATVTSSNSGINGTLADVNGINDAEFGSVYTILQTIIDSFPPTSGDDLEAGDFPPIVNKTKTPVVKGPIRDTHLTINGFISEASGTAVEVFAGPTLETAVKIGSTVFSTGSFTWSLTLGSPLAEGTVVYAVATATGKAPSDPSAPVVVTDAPSDPELACLAGVTVTIGSYSTSANQTASGTISGLPTAHTNYGFVLYYAGTNNVAWTRHNNNNSLINEIRISPLANATSWSRSVSGSERFPNGVFEAVIYEIANPTCQSPRSAPFQTEAAAVGAPTITPSQYSPTETAITGTISSSANGVALYRNGQWVQTLTLNNQTSFSFTGLNLNVGDQFVARAREGTGTLTAPHYWSGNSNTATVVAGEDDEEPDDPFGESDPPVITGSYANNDDEVFGYSSEDAGTIIRLYRKDGMDYTLLGEGVVGLTGLWTVETDVPLQTNWVIIARALAPGKSISEDSNEVTVLAAEILKPVVDTDPIFPNTAFISVSNRQGTTLLYADGNELGDVSSGTLNIGALAPELQELIREGVIIYAINFDGGAESEISNLVEVSALPPSDISLLASPDSPFAGDIATVYAFVTDAYGAAASDGIMVTFSIQSGNGSLIGNTTVPTNAFGFAQIQYQTHSGVETATIEAEFTESMVTYSGDVDITTQVAPIRPEVVTLTPLANATGVALDATVSIEFDQDVYEGDFDAISIVDSNGNPVSGVSAVLEADDRTVTISHDNFVEDEIYTVTVPAFTVVNNSGQGNPLTIWSFSAITSGPIELTLGGSFTANNKVYDATTAATMLANNLTLVGAVGGDDVEIDGVTLAFAQSGVGTDIVVSITGFTLSGADAGKYSTSVAGAPTAQANITPKALTIGGSFTANNKVYDGNPSAVIDDNSLTLVGVEAGDVGNVSIDAVTAVFDNANVGTDKTVSLSALTITGSAAGNYTVDLTGSPTTLADITVGPISASKSTVTVNPASLAVDGESTVTITLMDEFENRIGGLASGDFSIGLTGDATLVPGSFTAVGNGVYTIKVTNATAEQITVTVTADGTTLDTKPAITFSASSISASVSTVTANPTTLAAGNESTITITLRDANSNLISDIPSADFTFGLTGDASVVTGSFNEVGDGVYTVKVTNTKAEQITVTVTVQSIELNNKPQVTFTPGPISATESSVTVDPENVKLGGNSTVTITLRDEFGNLISDVPEGDFDIVLNGDATIVPGSFEETGNGVYIVKITNDTAEIVTVEVTVDDTELNDKPDINFEAPPVISLIEPTDGDLDSTSGTLGVTMFTPEKAVATLGSDKTVTWSISGGSDASLFEINQNGELSFINDSVTGTYVVQVTATDEVGNTSQLTVTVQVIQDCDPAADNAKISGFVIDDRDDSPLQHVMITLIPQGNTPGSILISITGADGSYEFSNLPSGDYLVQVQDENLNFVRNLYPVNSSLFFTTLESCVPQTHTFEYAPSDRPVLAGFVWYDANGDGIVNEWYDANDDGLVTQNFPDENGVYNWDEWEWIDVNGNGTWDQPEDLGELNRGGFGNDTFENIQITGPNGYDRGVIVGVGGQFRTRPANYGQYNVSLVEDEGLRTAALEMASSGLVRTLPNGGSVGKVAGGIPFSSDMFGIMTSNGSNQAICSYGGTIIAELSELNPVRSDLDFSVSCFTPGPITANVPNGKVGETTTITITVKDEDDNPLPGQAERISITMTGPNSGVGLSQIVDNGDGTYTVTYVPTTTGTDQFAITFNGTTIPGSPFSSLVTAGDISAANSTLSASPTTLTVGNTSTITVTLRDAANNAISGVTASEFVFTLGGSAQLIPASFTSTGNGVYTIGFTNTVPEVNLVRATVRGVQLTQQPSVTFTVGAPFAANSTASVPGGFVGEPTVIIVTLRDEFNNLVPGAAGSLSFSVSGANPGSVFSSVTDNGDGTYTVSYTPANAGNDLVSINVNNNPISGSPFNSTVIGPMSIGEQLLPSWTQDEPGYSTQLLVQGGQGPYTWSVVTGTGNLPDGLTLDPSTGLISGTPTVPGEFTFSAQVTDSRGSVVTRTYIIVIRPSTQKGVLT